MPDRLAELVRQRALVQEHLTWLDREIANATQPSPPTPAESTSSTGVLSVPKVSPAALAAHSSNASLEQVAPAAIAADSDNILEHYRIPPSAVQQDVRKGCFLYFAAALVVLGLGVAVLYFIFS